MTMSADTRQRMIAAAERGLAWRRERIMLGRLVVVFMVGGIDMGEAWHSLFECDRHGHHPLTSPEAKWVGPYLLGLDENDPAFDVGG